MSWFSPTPTIDPELSASWLERHKGCSIYSTIYNCLCRDRCCKCDGPARPLESFNKEQAAYQAAESLPGSSHLWPICQNCRRRD